MLFLVLNLQFIASAPTLFPPDYVLEFQRCFDQAPSVPFQEIQAILRQELGIPIDTVFDYVDPTPLASASIAQVCRTANNFNFNGSRGI